MRVTVDDATAAVESCAEVAEGLSSPYASLDQRTAINQARLEAELSSDLAALTATVDREISAIVARIRTTRPTTVSWHGGVSITSVTVATTLDGSSVSDCDYWQEATSGR